MDLIQELENQFKTKSKTGTIQEKEKIAGNLAIDNGWCVLQCLYDTNVNNVSKEIFDLIEKEHLKRIDLSDAIYVVNIGGYIGNSTRNEINYALSKGKEVIYHEFNLLTELKNYKPFDETEEENVKRVINFLSNNSNCYDRSNKEGHITAGGLVVDGKGSVLLNHHKKTGWWFQFGGHSDGESNCINVARREIGEEAGILDCLLISNRIFDVDVQRISYSAKKNEPEHFHFDINFLFYVKDKKFEMSNESTEIKWVSIKEAKKLINKEDKAMTRMLKKYENYLKSNS